LHLHAPSRLSPTHWHAEGQTSIIGWN